VDKYLIELFHEIIIIATKLCISIIFWTESYTDTFAAIKIQCGLHDVITCAKSHFNSFMGG
jgi:hypothetical protein